MYLIKAVETYRFETEKSAKEYLEEMKENDLYEITKSVIEKKEVKEKKEIVGEYYLMTVTKIVNDPKDPINSVEVVYQ